MPQAAATVTSAWEHAECLNRRFQSLADDGRPAFLLHNPGMVPRLVPPNTKPVEQPLWSYSRAMHGSTSKATKGSFVQWLLASNYSHAWTLEDDVMYTGRWGDLFSRFDSSDADLVALVDEADESNYWNTHGCTICLPPPGVTYWPALRMSKRLAQEIVLLAESGEEGHHEVFVAAVCKHTSWCQMEALDWERIYLPNKWTRNRCCRSPEAPMPHSLYHPVKCDARDKTAIDMFSINNQSIPRFEGGKRGRPKAMSKSLLSLHPGYCAKTDLRYDREKSSCTGSNGTQGSRCRYVSFSYKWRDCSWFHNCNLSNLYVDIHGFQTTQVKSIRRGNSKKIGIDWDTRTSHYTYLASR